MTKKSHQNFRRVEIVDFLVKFLKKVVLKFFGQMCSGEFFLKHALNYKLIIIRPTVNVSWLIVFNEENNWKLGQISFSLNTAILYKQQ